MPYNDNNNKRLNKIKTKQNGIKQSKICIILSSKFPPPIKSTSSSQGRLTHQTYKHIMELNGKKYALP